MAWAAAAWAEWIINPAYGRRACADWWFARAIDGQKSIPFAYSYWGQALLDRGDPDGAIAKFTLANQKGPKFADPLEMWGEAQKQYAIAAGLDLSSADNAELAKVRG